MDFDFEGVNLQFEPKADGSKLRKSPRKSHKKRSNLLLKVIFSFAVLIGLLSIVVFKMLKPINQQEVEFNVSSGASVAQILDDLESKGVIRSATVAKIYLKLTNFNPQIKAGDYKISPGLNNLRAVFNQLTEPSKNTKNITFYPGGTLNFRNSKTDTTPSHREVMKKVGFSDQQISEVFDKHRDHKLFEILPKVDNLEGLIFGETFEIFANSSPKDVLNRNFDHYYKVIKENELEKSYKQQGLTLYQGIILASIVEREVNNPADRKMVAQVFLKRYKEGIMLGSDVTYQYASRLAGIENDLYIKSPFNTRQNTGLTPTPIATPSVSSLLAVAHPSDTDYLFFVAGDDEKTYFAKTLAEHNKNVKQYCHKKCAVH